MDKREQILKATISLLATQGLQNCPMSQIAKHAGCGAGTIYRYFETKEDLISQLHVHIREDLRRACEKGIENVQGIKNQLLLYWTNCFEYFRAHPQEMALLDQMSACPAAYAQRHNDVGYVRMNALFTQGKEQSLIKNVDNDVLISMTFGSLFHLARRQHYLPEYASQVEIEDLMNLCWDAIKR